MVTSIPYAPDMGVGKGYNLLIGDALPSPAVTGTLVAVEAAGGQEVTAKIVRIDDLATLRSSLGVGVDASGSYGSLSGSVKVDFAESSEFSQYSKYLLVRVTVRNATLTFDDPKLTADASELIQNDNPVRFRERFGDVFLSGIERGGEYFALYQISGYDEAEKQSVAVAIQASFEAVVASADLQTKIATAKETSKSHLDVSTRVFQQGSIDTTPQSVDEIMARAKSFPPSVAGELAYPYAMLVEEYRSLKLPSDSFNPLDIANQQQVLADLELKRLDFLTLRNNIHYILKQPAAFEGADLPTLQTWLTEVSAALSTLHDQAVACAKDATRCEYTPLDAGLYPLPRLKPAEVLPAGPIPFPIAVGMDWRAAVEICRVSGLTYDDNYREQELTTVAWDQDGNPVPVYPVEQLEVGYLFRNEAPGRPGEVLDPGTMWNRADIFWMMPRPKK